MTEYLLDSLKDSVRLLPFLFLTYLLMEALEHKAGSGARRRIQTAGKFGPLWGGILGVVPQCGFSAAASSLFAGRVITVGTLLAIYLSTSDEMLPIMISNAVPAVTIAGILATKVCIAVITGFFVEFVFRYIMKRQEGEINIHAICEEERCDCQHGILATKVCIAVITGFFVEFVFRYIMKRQEGEINIHAICEEERCDCQHGIVRSALIHTGKIFLYILLISLILNIIIGVIGRDTLAGLFSGFPVIGEMAAALVGLIPNCASSVVITQLYLDEIILLISLILNIIIGVIGRDTLAGLFSGFPVIGEMAAALVGLIPNCASSVVITQLYLDEIIGAGAMMSGLLVNAGIGLLVLFRLNRDRKQNLSILVALYGLGVFWGVVIELLGIVF